MRNPFRRRPLSSEAGALAYGDEDFFKLDQFRTGARIVKQVPVVRGEAEHGWYGGEPRMPSYFSWPVGPDGEPLIFLAQLDCRALPAKLWGSVGPREGWLLFFIGHTFIETDSGQSFPVRVLHTMELGLERPQRLIGTVEWLATYAQNCSGNAPVMLPRWPITIYENETGAEERYKPFVGTGGWDDQGRPAPSMCRWPGGAAGNPLAWDGVAKLFEALRNRLEKVEQRNDDLLERFHKQIAAFEAYQAGTKTDISDADQLQFEYTVAKRRLDELAATRALNSAARTRLEAVIAAHPAERHPELLSPADWQGLSDELAAILFAEIEEHDVVFAVSRVFGESYSEQRFELEQATNLEDLRRKVFTISYKISRIAKKLDNAASNRVHLLNSRSNMTAQALAFQSACLEYAEKTLDQAQRYAAAAKSAHKELHALAVRLWNPNTSLESSAYEARALVAGIVVMDFEFVEISKGRPVKQDYEIRMRSLIDTSGSFDRWSIDLEIHRKFHARFLYCADPLNLPEPVRTHFEPIWSSAALDCHDGMGGVPRWEWVSLKYFNAPMYYDARDRKRFLKENALMASEYIADPPFDRDNAVLLQLFPDAIFGWRWGKHLTLIVPRHELAQANFENIRAVISG